MFTVIWMDSQTCKWHSEEVDSYKHARRMAAELRQLGVKWLSIQGLDD